MRAWPSPLQGPVSSTDREQSPAQDAFVQMKGCACARFEFWASPCVQFMSAPSMFIRGDGMQMRESDVGENPPNSGMVYLSGESQTPPAYPNRADENEAGIQVQWGEFPMNLPEAAHVASTAPPAARVGMPVAERCHRRAHSTTGPQCRFGST